MRSNSSRALTVGLAASAIAAAFAACSMPNGDNQPYTGPMATGGGGAGGSGGTGGAAGGTTDGGSDSGGASGGTCASPQAIPECPGSACTMYACSSCLAYADNAGAASGHIQMRFSQLIVSAPPQLASPFIKDTIVAKAVRIPNTDCNVDGTGQFSWLFDFDTTNNTMMTGGGPPVPTADAAKAGTCFLEYSPQAGVTVAPTKNISATISSDGSFSTPTPIQVTVPIFLNPDGTSVVLLPLNGVLFGNVASGDSKMSADRNCLGNYSASTLTAANYCLPTDNDTYFENGGDLSGYITVDQAEGVNVVDLKETLCVLLNGGQYDHDNTYPDGYKHCTSDGNHHVTGTVGDWQSDPAGGTGHAQASGDAWHLVANFSASAIKIKGTATKMDCSDAK